MLVSASATQSDEMERKRLEEMTVTQLKAEATRYQLPGIEDRDGIIDAIMSHLERNGPVIDWAYGGRRSAEQEVVPPTEQASSEQSITGNNADQSLKAFLTTLTAMMQTQHQQTLEQLRQMQQQLLQNQQTVVQQVSAQNDGRVTQTVVESPGRTSRSGASDAANSQNGTRSTGQTSISSMPTANAVTLLSQQIPEFSGGDEENVKTWIQRVDRVAQIHRVADDVTLLAASSKLTKAAKKWYELQSGTMLESWTELRSALLRMFERKLPFYVQMQKVEARRWMYSKESFQQYAIEKLALMHSLNLTVADSINLLIGGISKASLRATASTVSAETLDQFLEKMRQITAASSETDKRSAYSSKGNKNKDQTCTNCGKKGHATKDCRNPEIVCFFCKEKGHRKPECPRWKNRAETAAGQARSGTAVSAVAETAETAETSETIASVMECRSLAISNKPVKLRKINNVNCELRALVDTGSPVSFIKRETFKNLFRGSSRASEASNRKFNALNDLPIETYGSVQTEITLEQWPEKPFKVEFHILQNKGLIPDCILGRDFLAKEKITLVCDDESTESEIQLLACFNVSTITSDYKDKLNNCEIDCSESEKCKLIKLLEEVENSDIEKIEDDYCVRINLKDKSTFAFAPRKFAFEERKQVREIIDDLLTRDIIKESVSPYCSRIVPVRKRNGSLRLCVDLRPLNNRIVRQRYPFPIIEDCLARLGNKSIFTVLDLKDGFHQIKLHADDTKYFSFATPDGQYEYKRLPFGYSESPAEFQRRLVNILQPLIREDKIIVYIDDIMIATDTVESNLKIIKEVLEILKKYSFEINLDKCQFLRKRVEYLGYTISEQGITLSERHTEAIRKFPQPKSVHELQSFLGLTNYFRKFIKGYATLARPMYNLLKKSATFDFDSNCVNAFKKLKSELIAYPVLRLYNPKAETELHTDASALGIAGILMQKQGTGVWAPVAYFSQATNEAEKKYHSFELEMLAIVKAIERFHMYLYGLEFTVITDCNALVYAVNKANLNPRIARWTLALQNYMFKLAHRPGVRMAHVDALSRQVFYVNALPIERELEFRQLQDNRLKEIAKELEFQANEKFQLIDGLVYKKDSDNYKFCVPDAMINSILRAHHDDMAHCGVEKTVAGIRNTYWFPSMRRKVIDYIDNCIVCLMSNASAHSKEGEMIIDKVPSLPFDTIHIDHFGPLPETADGYKYVFVVIDAFSRYTWLLPAKSTTALETCDLLKLLFNIFGVPKEIVSDRGTAFTAYEFTHLIESLSIKHRKVAVASPWANGLAERVNRFLKSSLIKLVDDPHTWKSKINVIQYVMNNTCHTAIKSSPSKVLLGYEQRNHADCDLKRLTERLTGIDHDIENERMLARDAATIASDKIRNYNKLYYDKKHNIPTKYKEGDFVLIRDTQLKPGQSKKLKSLYKGPYLVAKSLDKNRYVINDVPGFNLSSRPYNTILSPDKLKPWNGPSERTNADTSN